MNETIHLEPNVKILGMNPHGKTMCAAASRISTTNGTAISLFERSVDNPNNDKLVKNVLSSGHRSVIEHCFFNIAFNNVSVFVEQYVIEFRLASFTVQSRRYVDFSNVGFYTAPSLSEDAARRYGASMEALFAAYDKLLALDIPKEDARFVLPYCFHSNFYCSCNARELLHMICTMVYGRGSVFEELRTLGTRLAEEFEQYFPGEIEKSKSRYSAERERAAKWVDALSRRRCEPPKTVRSETRLLAHSTVSSAELLECMAYNFATEPTGGDAVSALYGSRSRELELINMSFRIHNVSLSAITHLVRHRIQSVLVPCVGNAVYDGRCILPPSVAENQEAKAVYEQAFRDNAETFRGLIEDGMEPIHCVYFALSGNTLDVISSMNGREFTHFTQLRACNRAQWEIRKVSEDMLKLARTVYPDIFSGLGPNCFMSGSCPEGKKTCGKMAEMKKYYGEL